MKNKGKIFEAQWKMSIPDYVLLYKLPDSAQSFNDNKFNKENKIRFSSKSPFDYLMWDSQRHNLYALEMKTKCGKSISFERDKKDKGDIHYHQIKKLNEWDKYDGIICGFIIEFREIETTIFLDIKSFNKILKKIDKRSFNYSDLEKNKIPYIIIPQKKKRTQYIYDVEKFLSENS